MKFSNYLGLSRPCNWSHLLIAFLPVLALADVRHLTDIPFQGKTSAEFTSGPLNFEAPHLSAVNGSSFQWWWFDVLTTSTNVSALNIIFFDAANAAFPLTEEPDNILSVWISGYNANGTQFAYSIPVTNASVTWGKQGKLDLGDGVFGSWQSPDINATFSAPDGLGYFDITIDSPAYGVHADLHFTNTATPHYPCGTAQAGEQLRVAPHIGWANAMPSADVTGTITMGNGTETMHFSNALGYHDMNWSNRPLFESINSWYWGHAKLGPYTLVWYDALDSTGAEHVGGFVSVDGHGSEPIMSSCKLGDVRVRPQGKGAQYPPDAQHSDFASLHVELHTEDGLLVADVVPMGDNLVEPGLYQLKFGQIKGGLQGGEVYEGIAEFEEFTVLGFEV